ERRRIRRGAAVVADELQPRQRTAGEILGAEIVDGGLAGDGAEHEPDKAHVVEEGQPRRRAFAGPSADAVGVHGETVGQQTGVRYHDAGRETRRTGTVLYI